MKRYKVVYIDFPLPSFKWANGLYALIGKRGEEYEMCAIREGMPELFEGRPVISVTGVNNEGIKETNLTIKI